MSTNQDFSKRTMKAAILTRIGGPLEVTEVGLGPLGFGQVLVRVLASGICGAQLQEIAGHKGNAGFLPHLLGHEGCGIVEGIGAGVSRVRTGDKVVMHWRKAAGIESHFPTYIFGDREIRSGKVTTFSEYSIVSENRLTPVPIDTPVELCALLGCGLSTALCTVEREAEVKFGESVLVVGAGGLGMNLIRAASLANAFPIMAMDIHQAKYYPAMDMGAHAFICVGKESPRAYLDGFKLKGFDVIIDTAGAGGSMEETLQLLAPTGRFIMVGQPEPGRSVEIRDAKHLFEGEGKTIKATQGGGFQPEVDIPRYVRLHHAGLLSLQTIISDRIPLEDINRGIDLVRAGQASRVLVEIGRE